MSVRRNQRGGFTLLELLMVVIIIAILASIALPQFIKATEKARATEALQLLGNIRSAQARYKAESPNNIFASNQFDLDTVDAVTPIATKFWGAVGGPATNLALDTNVAAFLIRNSGAYSTQVLGVYFLNGNICGNFANSVLGPGQPAC